MEAVSRSNSDNQKTELVEFLSGVFWDSWPHWLHPILQDASYSTSWQEHFYIGHIVLSVGLESLRRVCGVASPFTNFFTYLCWVPRGGGEDPRVVDPQPVELTFYSSVLRALRPTWRLKTGQEPNRGLRRLNWIPTGQPGGNEQLYIMD